MSKTAISIYETSIFTIEYAIDTAKAVKRYGGTIDEIIEQLTGAKTRREQELQLIKEDKSNE